MKTFFSLYVILPCPLYLQVLIFEAAHTFGLCLLVFKVLPNFDMIRALLLMCTSSIIPALLKLLLTKVCIHNCNIFSLFVDSQCIMNTMTITFLRKYDRNIPEFYFETRRNSNYVQFNHFHNLQFCCRETGVPCPLLWISLLYSCNVQCALSSHDIGQGTRSYWQKLLISYM